MATDLNGDARLDPLGADPGAGSFSITLSDGNGSFLPALDAACGIFPRMVASADLDGDGPRYLSVTDLRSDDPSALLSRGVKPTEKTSSEREKALP